MAAPWRLHALGLIISTAPLLLSQEAHAQACGVNAASSGNAFSPPSLSATEVSTAQALEVMQRRKDEAVEVASLASEQTAAEASAPAPKPAAPAAGSSAAVQPATPKPVKKKIASGGVAKSADDLPPGDSSYGGSQLTKKGGWQFGSWATANIDYERNRDVNIGPSDTDPTNAETVGAGENNVTRTTLTTGALAGVDWTYLPASESGVGTQIGLFGGFSRADSKYSDGKYSAFIVDQAAGNALTEVVFGRRDASDSEEVGSLGLFASVFSGKYAWDASFKVDLGSLDSDYVATRNPTCGIAPKLLSGVADLAAYTLSSNISYKEQLSETTVFQPLFGIQFTYVDFFNQQGSLLVGAADGQTFRIQGGARFLQSYLSSEGYLVTTGVMGLIYSDVFIDGYVGQALTSTGFTDAATLNDEGKIRVLGRLSSGVDFQNGFSILGEAELRAGDEYFGVGGRLGGRYSW